MSAGIKNGHVGRSHEAERREGLERQQEPAASGTGERG